MINMDSNKLKEVFGIILIILAIAFFILSYTAYINGYHKSISSISNFSYLFTGIFWSIVWLFVAAVLFAIGLILAKPEWARWIVRRGAG